jgi:ribosome-associated translation inhibitor RaiA
MNISIVAKDYKLTEAIKREIISKLKLTLKSNSRKIRKTEITLSKQINSAGHTEKLCVMKVRINHLRALVAKTISNSMTESINSNIMLLRDRLEGKHINKKVV